MPNPRSLPASIVALVFPLGSAAGQSLVVERDNLAGAADMGGAFAADDGLGGWGMPGTLTVSSVNGTLSSYRARVYGLAAPGVDPSQHQWEWTDFEVHFWSSVSNYFASPQSADVQVAFLGPTNPDWFTPVGSYNGYTQYEFEFDLSGAGI